MMRLEAAKNISVNILFQVHVVHLLHCTYLLFMNTHESQINQAKLGSPINRHKTFNVCIPEYIFSLSLILPCCYAIHVSGVAPGVAGKWYQNLLRSKLTISRKKLVPKLFVARRRAELISKQAQLLLTFICYESCCRSIGAYADQ